MAEDPRFLLHFKTLKKFQEKLKDGTINQDRHLVYISDEKLVWCRGKLYSDYNQIKELNFGSSEKYKAKLELLMRDWDTATNTFKDRTYETNLSSTGGIVIRQPLSSEKDTNIVFDFSAEDCADKVLVTPTISPTWSFKNQAGTAVTNTAVGVSNVNAANITVETGYKVDLSATFKWVHDDNKKDPTSTNGSFGTTLPASNINSAVSTKTNVTATTTYTQNLVAPKKGFMIGADNKTIVAATGNDTTSASVKVTFGHRYYAGPSTSATPTEAIIKALGKTAVVTAKALTVTGITTTSAQYYVYAYPQTLGTLSQIIQDGATPITNAFNRTSVTIANAAGASIPLYVYTSVNPGAFNNAKIAFS